MELDTCRTSKLMWPSINTSKTNTLLKLNRNEIRTVVDIITGHCLLGIHARRMRAYTTTIAEAVETRMKKTLRFNSSALVQATTAEFLNVKHHRSDAASLLFCDAYLMLIELIVDVSERIVYVKHFGANMKVLLVKLLIDNNSKNDRTKTRRKRLRRMRTMIINSQSLCNALQPFWKLLGALVIV